MSSKLRKIVIGLLSLLVIGLGTYQATFTQTSTLDIPIEAKVASVYDGDTIRIEASEETVPVRLLGINTPELDGSFTEGECFGEEARNALRSKILNRRIQLENDPSQDNKDRYNRLLRYVYLDGENINLWLVKEGYAFEYTYDKPHKYQAEFREAEAKAANESKGLWNTCEI